MTVPAALPRVWRPLRARLVTLPVAALIFAGTLALAVALPDTWPVADRVGIAVIGTAAASVAAMLGRPVARADAGGLTVVNLLNRRRLAWSEIVRVGFGRDDPWVILDLDDGTTLAVMALQSADGDRGRAGARELAALVRAYGEGPP